MPNGHPLVSKACPPLAPKACPQHSVPERWLCCQHPQRGDRAVNRYVYGIVEASDALEFETDAVAGASTVYPIRHRRHAALVSDIETTDLERTDEDSRRHDEVLREAMEREGGRAIVPMRFGMIFESDRALKNVLRGGRAAFRRTMAEIDGRVELGVKLVRDADAIVDREAVDEDVAERLEEIAVDAVENDLFSDRLVYNGTYLVEEDDRERFADAVDAIDEAYEELTVRYTGPFAPYSFVDIEIGAQ